MKSRDVQEVAGQAVHRHGGSWQGFKSAIARYLGSDLTVVVLALAPDGRIAELSVRPRQS